MPTDVRTRGASQVKEVIRGQGGTPVAINESRFVTDEHILDPNSPLAVQIPEGVGADTSLDGLALADTLAEGHVEAKFDQGVADLPTVDDADAHADNDNVRAVGETNDKDFEPDLERVESPAVYNKSALQRLAEEGEVSQDVEAESPASSRPAEEDAEGDSEEAARADQTADDELPKA